MQRRQALQLILGFPAAALLPLPAQALALAAQARVDRSLLRGDIDIAAYVDVPADPGAAWSVLTDYNRLSEFVPDMRVSRVVSKPGQPIHVYQRGEKSWLLLGAPLELLFRMDETPPSRIQFRLVSGNINAMFGEWLILPQARATRIAYRAHMEPGMLSLRAPGDHLYIESEIASMMNAIGQEILKRRGLLR